MRLKVNKELATIESALVKVENQRKQVNMFMLQAKSLVQKVILGGIDSEQSQNEPVQRRPVNIPVKRTVCQTSNNSDQEERKSHLKKLHKQVERSEIEALTPIFQSTDVQTPFFLDFTNQVKFKIENISI